MSDHAQVIAVMVASTWNVSEAERDALEPVAGKHLFPIGNIYIYIYHPASADNSEGEIMIFGFVSRSGFLDVWNMFLCICICICICGQLQQVTRNRSHVTNSLPLEFAQQ